MKKLSALKRTRSTVKKTKKPAKNISFNQAILLIVVLALATLSVSGFYWYKNVFSDTDRVFDDMLNKSMQTTSIYRNVYQESGRNTIEQSIYTGFSPKTVAESTTKLEDNSTRNKTQVTTQTIGTPKEDFIRYTAIDIGGKQLNGLDQILGVWGSRQSNDETGDSVSFLSDALFVVVPFGNLNEQQRAVMTKEIKDTQLYKIKEAKTDFSSGRPTAEYTVSINPQSLIKVLVKYIEITGQPTNAQLDAQAYQQAQAIDARFEIDLMSRHLKSVTFEDAGRTETYQGYNVFRTVESPTKTISIDELQQRLQVLEQQQSQ